MARALTADEQEAWDRAVARQKEGEKYEPQEHKRQGRLRKLGAGLTQEDIERWNKKGENLPDALYKCHECRDSGFRTQVRGKDKIMYGALCVCRREQIRKKNRADQVDGPPHFLPE